MSLITLDGASGELRVCPRLQTLSATRAGFESVWLTVFPLSGTVQETAPVLNRLRVNERTHP